jgi:beta-lactamase superfamily II metal-dependent hydrolase
MSNEAKDLLWPSDRSIVLRVVFLYVGQGASAIVFARSGGGYKTLLVDINLDRKNGGIDVPRLMADLLSKEALEAFVNTHPHDDHLCGVTELSDAIAIRQVWHSGHVPSEKYGASYKDLKKVIKNVKDNGGTETILEGSRSAFNLGDIQYYVLSPAKHVSDEVNDESPDDRYERIHEQCAVLKFGVGDKWVMIAGDAEWDAFQNHIMYHKERLGAVALGASHHGSRTFFRETEDEEPFLDALKAINPQYVIISAPKKNESKHGHPHDDAVELYAEHVGEANVLHTGENRYCFICDIYSDGQFTITDDKGRLAETYGLKEDDGGDDGAKALRETAPMVFTRVDRRPMG